MSANTISVVVPHYNQPAELALCLEALHGQRGQFSLLEVIVVDNGSTASPARICESYRDVTLLTESDRGPGPVRNRGATAARGDILAFIDADCVASPGWLAAIAQTFGADDSRTILGGDVRIPRGSEPLGAIEAFESVFAYRMDKYIARKNFTGTGNLAVRRAVFETVGPFCTIDRAEDRDWGQRATALGFRVSFVPQMRVYHPARRSFGELARKWDRQLAHDFTEIVDRPSGRLRWIARAMAVAVSPVASVPQVLATDRLVSPGERLAAIRCLVRIRLYRCWRMLTVLFGDGNQRALNDWNRSSA